MAGAGRRNVFPWGSAWPPPPGAGNYAGEEVRAHVGSELKYLKGIDGFIEGYKDAFLATAPPGSFPANAFGICDLGGNLWEMCEDWLDGARRFRVMRGGSWMNNSRNDLCSSQRKGTAPTMHTRTTGFRVVLAPVAGGK